MSVYRCPSFGRRLNNRPKMDAKGRMAITYTTSAIKSNANSTRTNSALCGSAPSMIGMLSGIASSQFVI
jgi:hypothetical protein